MIPEQGVGSLTHVGRIGFLLSLVALSFSTEATPVADQFDDDVIAKYILDEPDQLEHILAPSSPASRNHLWSSSNQRSTLFPSGTTNNMLAETHEPQRPGATYFREETATSHLHPLIDYHHAVGHHEVEVDCHHNRLAGVLDSDFEWADILRAAVPGSAHVQDNLDGFPRWKDRLFPAEARPSLPTGQASDSLRLEHDAATRQIMADDSGSLPISEIHAPPELNAGSLAGQYAFGVRSHHDESPNVIAEKLVREHGLGEQSYHEGPPDAKLVSEYSSGSNLPDAHRATIKRKELRPVDKLAGTIHSDDDTRIDRRHGLTLRQRVAVAVKLHMKPIQKGFETYFTQQLAKVSDRRLRLLDDGNFVGIEEHDINFFIKSDSLDQNEFKESVDILYDKLRHYKASYKPARKKQGQTDLRQFRREYGRLKHAREQSDFHVIYLAAIRRLNDNGLAERIEHIIKNGFDRLVEHHHKHEISKILFFTSWYECIKYTTIIMLYQVELMYRLSIHMDRSLELEKNNSLESVLISLNRWWLNFPFVDKKPGTSLESNDLFSETIMNEIRKANGKHKCYVKYQDIPKIFLSNWFMRKNPTIFEGIKDPLKQSLLMPGVFKVMQDCAWIEYVTKAKTNHLN